MGTQQRFGDDGPRRRQQQRLTAAVIARRQLELRALELRTAGYTLERIAWTLGFANRGMASKYIRRVLARNESESVEEHRRIMQERLDMILRALWPLINRPRPSLAAIDRYLKVHDRLVKLNGLDQGCSCGHQPFAPSDAALPPSTQG